MKKLREIMWEGNVPRWHDVKQVFAGTNPLDFMMYGTVTQRLPKEDVELDWAGHMILEDHGGRLFVKDYQVFAVRSLVTVLTGGQHTLVRSESTAIMIRLC